MPSLRESILKDIHFYIIPRTRERKFSGAQFPYHRCGNVHTTDVETEPAVLKEIPPLFMGGQRKLGPQLLLS